MPKDAFERLTEAYDAKVAEADRIDAAAEALAAAEQQRQARAVGTAEDQAMLTGLNAAADVFREALARGGKSVFGRLVEAGRIPDKIEGLNPSTMIVDDPLKEFEVTFSRRQVFDVFGVGDHPLATEAPFMTDRPELHLCECGHARRDHRLNQASPVKARGCVVCACENFRFYRSASLAEIEAARREDEQFREADRQARQEAPLLPPVADGQTRRDEVRQARRQRRQVRRNEDSRPRRRW